MDQIKNIPNNSIHLIILDPPYGKGKGIKNDDLPNGKFRPLLKKWIDVIVPKLREDGSLYCFMGYDNYDFTKFWLMENGLILRRELIWWYPQGGDLHGSDNYPAEYDKIMYFVKSKKRTYNPVRRPPSERVLKAWKSRVDSEGYRKWEDLSPKQQDHYGSKKMYDEKRGWKVGEGKPVGSVIPIPKVNPWSNEYTDHPTQKPELLIELFIKISSNEGDIVCDPFCGSGTVPSIAKKFKRRYVGIEIDEHHHQTTVERVSSTETLNKIHGYFIKPEKKDKNKKIGQYFVKD